LFLTSQKDELNKALLRCREDVSKLEKRKLPKDNQLKHIITTDTTITSERVSEDSDSSLSTTVSINLSTSPSSAEVISSPFSSPSSSSEHALDEEKRLSFSSSSSSPVLIGRSIQEDGATTQSASENSKDNIFSEILETLREMEESINQVKANEDFACNETDDTDDNQHHSSDRQSDMLFISQSELDERKKTIDGLKHDIARKEDELRILRNKEQNLKGKVRVNVRVRPSIEIDGKYNQHILLCDQLNKTIKTPSQSFQFDIVHDTSASQADVYEVIYLLFTLILMTISMVFSVSYFYYFMCI
jgi:hypothetical protein